MKSSLLLALFLGLAPTYCLAQDEADAPAAELLQWQIDLSNLPEDRRTEFARYVTKARELFQQKRIFETVEELNNAIAIFPDSPDVENMLGACQVEFRSFDKAMDHFSRANKLAPDQTTILFNIAEVQFVSKDWAKAERSLAYILEKMNANGELVGQEMQMSRLIEFKLMLSKIKLGKMDEAMTMAEKYDHLDDSPFCYYSEAAIAYQNEDELTAEAAMARAGRVFRSPGAIAPWQDTMMEFGYVKSFFGGDLEEEE